MCSSRATFLFYLFVLASSILCAVSTAFAPQKLNLGQSDIALAISGANREVVMSDVLTHRASAAMSTYSFKVAATDGENRRLRTRGEAGDLAMKVAFPLMNATQL